MIMGVMYSLAALAMLIVGIVLLLRRGQSEPARNAAVAALVSAGWAALMFSQSAAGAWPTWNAMMADGFRFGAWLVALRALALVELPTWLRRVSLGLCAALIIYTSFGAISQSMGGVRPLRIASLAGFIASLAALAATVHLWRQALHGVSREVRWCAAAVSGQFAIDALTYAQAQWQGNVDPSLSALRLGAVVIATVPLALSAWRLPIAAPRVFISRQVVFYLSSFGFLALYFVLTALGAFHAHKVGGESGGLLQTLVIGGAAALLIVFLLAEWPMRRLRVFISTHFYRNKYDYRIEWLRFVQTLSAGEEPDARRNAIRAVAQIFGSTSGLLMLREQDAGHFYLQAAWPEKSTDFPQVTAIPQDHELPRLLRDLQWVVDLREFSLYPERYGQLQLPAWLDPKGPWRVIAPLLVGNQLLGILVLRAPPEPFTITFEDLDLLKTVGRNVAVQLAQRRADEQLAESRQFDAYNRFAAFVMHDLKNSVAQLQLLVANAGRHRHNPVFVDDAIDTIRNTSERMTRLIEQLQGRDMHGTARMVDLAPIVAAAVARGQSRQPSVALDGEVGSAFVQADPDRLTAVLEHIMRNAQEACGANGAVTVKVEADLGEARVIIVDDGVGMDEEFLRHRLFRPFDSTKGSKGMGIGAYQVREYARAMGGDIEVWSAPGRGTRFCIRLPLCPKKNQNS
ncbi:MAG TPA: XrtA/PEP-CTERM system histidine kinase PrsK [Steroidobacteraceae bacterium]|jgi:putative PEP-CTERM system histidine kinase|nr:XrtA/PEP-CTERM system histidine kinase PrsK [Steroidobacteraceae bacterium]